MPVKESILSNNAGYSPASLLKMNYFTTISQSFLSATQQASRRLEDVF